MDPRLLRSTKIVYYQIIDGGNKSMSSTDPKGLKVFKRTYSDYRMRDVVEDSKSEKFCLNNEVFEKAAAEMYRKAKWS